jgi:hypothetical protein
MQGAPEGSGYPAGADALRRGRRRRGQPLGTRGRPRHSQQFVQRSCQGAPTACGLRVVDAFVRPSRSASRKPVSCSTPGSRFHPAEPAHRNRRLARGFGGRGAVGRPWRACDGVCGGRRRGDLQRPARHRKHPRRLSQAVRSPEGSCGPREKRFAAGHTAPSEWRARPGCASGLTTRVGELPEPQRPSSRAF